MANNLTGDFDVVAEFAVLAVDRLLAAMHQTGRFLHSISVRVDDNPHPTKPYWPVVLGTVDAFGDAIANQRQIGRPNPFPGAAAVTNPTYARLGVLLNPDALVNAPPRIIPSHISGLAQLQLFPPTIAVPETAGSSLTVRMNLMARFFPDKDTAPLAQFIRGDLQITAPMNKIVSGSFHVLDIDFRADDASINFTPSYSSNALSIQDLVGINLCIQNGLRTSFLPSSVTLPGSIAEVQLKTLPGAIAVMLDFSEHASTVASVTNVFLGGDDDFAFAVGRDYLLGALSQISNNIMSQTFAPVKFTLDLTVWGVGETLHYSYAINLTSASFDLQTGKIVLTINGNAGPAAHIPHNFSFTVTVNLSLQASGSSVELVVGDVSVTTSSSLAGIVDFFTGDITNSVKSAISAAITATGANATVNSMFDADTNLGNFLNTQLNPADGTAQFYSQQVFLLYTSVDIQTAGVVLHGSLLVFDWPAPYVEFEPIPQHASGNGVVVTPPIYHGTDYSALKTWIPGGTIGQYEWSAQGQEQAYPFDVDPNRFVLLQSGEVAAEPDVARATESAAVPGYSPLCLTITGNRISNYGSPPVFQPVKATTCGYTKFPIVLGGTLSAAEKAIPMLSITRPGPSGNLIVSGQVAPDIDRSGSAAPNLIVHFADSQSSGELELLTKGLNRSRRKDASTGIISVLTPDQMSKARYTPGIVYAEDTDGSWQEAFGVTSAKRPLTLIVGPRGSVAWQHEGPLDVEKLAAVLTRHLVKRAPVRLSLPRLNLRIGQSAPNFLFEYAPGREMPLSKLSGQPVILVFWKSSVKASIQAVRDLQTSQAGSATSTGSAANSSPKSASKAVNGKSIKTKSTTPIVLAVNDGEDPSVARAAAAESGITAILVTDPKREIGVGYGVDLWPTIVSLDQNGVVAGIRYGHVPGENLGSGSKTDRASSS